MQVGTIVHPTAGPTGCLFLPSYSQSQHPFSFSSLSLTLPIKVYYPLIRIIWRSPNWANINCCVTFWRKILHTYCSYSSGNWKELMGITSLQVCMDSSDWLQVFSFLTSVCIYVKVQLLLWRIIYTSSCYSLCADGDWCSKNVMTYLRFPYWKWKTINTRIS